MTFEGVLSIAHVRTLGTLEGFLPRVSSGVAVTTFLCCKFPRAVGALEGLFPAVSSPMICHGSIAIS